MKSALLLFSLFCIAVSLAARTDRVQVAQRGDFPSWELGRQASADELVSFTVFLKQKNLDVLYETFKRVSNPRSADWGQFLTKEEMEALVRPDEIAFDTVKAWLGRKCHSVVETADSVVVVTSAAHAAELFDTPFYHFQHTSGREVVKIYGRATIPAKVALFVHFVAGISELFSGSPIQINGVNRVQQDTIITPTVLKQFYQVPDLNVTNSENLQGIAAFQDYFSMGALEQFAQSQGLPVPDVTRIGPDCFPNCDQYESDLDIQYITSMAIGAKTVFINQAANYWILQFCEEVLASSPIPYVFSISYGWSELQQCDIAVANCDKLGYNSQQYVERTNTDFQKLGTVGTSVLVSDGDDGAPSLGAASGNCPMDPSIYCPVGGCDHSTSKCNSFQVLNTTTNQYCFFPAGIGSNACAPVLNDPNFDSALEDFLSTNYRCSANIESDYEQLPHFYSSCPCSRLQSVTSNGYVISQYTYNIANGAPFTADYPTSSPFVTSVGATQFLSQTGGGLVEVAASILTHAIITTGGGFSSFQAAEDYQSSAVQAWLSAGDQLPPSNTFDTSMRGYPDVAFNGHNYLVYYSNDTSDNCPCLSTEVDGTSASSPALAGLVTLLNDQLLNAGKSPIGFLNYLLYQMAEENPGAFFDITSGNNKCSRAYCCLYGYTAVSGWDPVSGLGSPNFEEWLRYVTNAKGIAAY